MSIPTPLLVVIATVALVVVAPFYVFVGFDLALRFLITQRWEIGGIFFDQRDIVFAGLLAASALRGGGLLRLVRSVPYIKTWAVLGVLLSMAYVTAPINQKSLVGPIQILYQVYRYCWQGFLMFPLAAAFITDSKKAWAVLVGLVVATDLCAAKAIFEGYQGLRSGGFIGANLVGSAYSLPVVVSLAAISSQRRPPKQAVFFWVSLAMMARAILFSGSRGSMIGLFCGVIFFLGMLMIREPSVRPRMLRFMMLMVLFLVTFNVLTPNLSDRPNIERAMTATNPLDQDTLQWRLEERWPFFLEIVKANPWLGVGTAVAPELGRSGSGNTPHSGYLALAVTSGVPALILTLFLLANGGMANYGLSRASPISEVRLITLCLVSSMVGIAVHNIAENTFLSPLVSGICWFSAAIGLTWRREYLLEARRARYGTTDDQASVLPDPNPSEKTVSG